MDGRGFSIIAGIWDGVRDDRKFSGGADSVIGRRSCGENMYALEGLAGGGM